jgi:amyloid beta precursor protein binding protein 1
MKMDTNESSANIASPNDSKSKKYDRQLRLWGDHGQSSLESAKICLVNATATGTEILKNLILPGIGSFTIVDDHKVTGEDAGNNFFLDGNSIGQSRAQATTDFLLELNEDVCGDYIEDTVENLLEKCATFFNTYQLVIATNLPERSLLRLAAVLWENDIPLLVCRSFGLIGYIRLVVKEHTVIESHPDNVHDDLRLDRPFPGLIQYADSFDLSTMNKKEHSQTPWLIVLYKFLQQWKIEHNGAAPSNYREKTEFKDQIKKGILRNADGMQEEEENFHEAIQHVNTALLPTRIPDEVRKILDDESCVNLNSESKPFWIMARAVKEFVDKEGQGLLPIRGSIPDMTADSDRYIHLQSVYREQASQDISNVTSHLLHLLQTIGRDEPLSLQKTRSPASSPASKPQDNITDDDIRTFCKNSSFLRVVSCRSLAAEYDPLTSRVSQLAMGLDDADSEDLVYYILLRAVDRFFVDSNRFPGEYDDLIEPDIPAMKGNIHRLLHEWGVTQSVKDDFIHEMCRYGAAELPAIAAFIGGIAAQEAIKIITGQFVPINNTFIYNGMKQTSVTVEL